MRRRIPSASSANELEAPAADTTEVELRVGRRVQAIAQLARKAKADLIVLGSHRRRTLAPLIGTTAERIIAGSRRPALIVNRESQRPYRELLIAAEISDTLIDMVRVARSLRLLTELLIMGTRARTAMSRLLRASVATDVVRNLDCDILAIPLRR